MGRGRAKAKQAKVARQLKYSSDDTVIGRLHAELAADTGSGDAMAEWWAIEVFDTAAGPARAWRDAYEDALTEAAVTNGAAYWEWHATRYGVIFEVLFPDDARWEAFRELPAVRAALDHVPDPVNGLLIYRGRGGASGSGKPRKPKPAPSASAVELPEPAEVRRGKLPSSAPPTTR